MNQESFSNEWKQTSVLDLWHRQVVQHHKEEYKGIGMAKFPQDLWSYEKLINSTKPTAILEVGINKGGFTKWLHDRLLLASWEDPDQEYIVIGLDLDIKCAQKNLEKEINNNDSSVSIELIECDLLNKRNVENVVKKIGELVEDKQLLIIEDSGHTYETTKVSLEAFSELLKPGEWFIVEDTCVDIEELRESVEWPRGALNAVNTFLTENHNFERSTFNNMYTITCHPFGFLVKCK